MEGSKRGAKAGPESEMVGCGSVEAPCSLKPTKTPLKMGRTPKGKSSSNHQVQAVGFRKGKEPFVKEKFLKKTT